VISIPLFATSFASLRRASTIPKDLLSQRTKHSIRP
jgi:hypothetical protein